MYSARRLDIYVKSSDGMAGPGSGDEFGAGCGRGGWGMGGGGVRQAGVAQIWWVSFRAITNCSEGAA